MAEWVLVFTPPDVQPSEIGRLLSKKSANRVSLLAGGRVLDVQRGVERVVVDQDNTVSVIAEYEPGELATVLASVPLPNVFRVSYYRGTALLAEVLHSVLRLNDQVFVDNDLGVIAPLDVALTQGLPEFLASRGST